MRLPVITLEQALGYKWRDEKRKTKIRCVFPHQHLHKQHFPASAVPLPRNIILLNEERKQNPAGRSMPSAGFRKILARLSPLSSEKISLILSTE